MPKTILRQFTGGIANEIDAQNLRDDQGEEAVDINLKGFALEPGEGLAPLTDSGHYYYRGEWIKDSEAVSFEESGVGVIKTYDTKRPQFEEIINDKDNIARDLGPSLPPGAVITGTIVSEGTRGERPGDGSHLLQLPSDKLGAIDTLPVNALTISNGGSGYTAGTLSASIGGFAGVYTVDGSGTIDSVTITNGGKGYVNAPTVIITEGVGSSGTNAVITASTEDAPSLVEHKATSTKDEDHIYYYSGQPYWVEKTGGTWNVKTRAYVNNAFTGNDITSGNLTRNSGGSFFKENYFICWDAQFIETVALSNTSMSVNSLDTLDTSQNGDVGSNFGFDSTSIYPATAKEISSVDICNGVVTFTQKIETSDRSDEGDKDMAIPKYTNSDDERWILPRKNDSYILLLRDGFAYKDWGYQGIDGQTTTITSGTPAESSGAYNLGDDDVKLFTVANPSGDATWITPRDSINRGGFGDSSHQYDIGLKYIVKHFPKGTWGCVRQLGANKPEIMVIEANAGVGITAQNAKDVTVKRSFSETTLADFLIRTGQQGERNFHKMAYYRLHIHINMELPKINGSIYWEGDPIPGKYTHYSDWTTRDNSGNKQKAGGGGLVYPTHARGGGIWSYSYGNRFQWMDRHNQEYQTMSNPVHPTNWYGHDWNRGGGRHQFSRYVARAKPTLSMVPLEVPDDTVFQWDKGLYSFKDRRGSLVKQPVLYDGYGLVKNTIAHPLYYDNEGSERSEVAFKNTSIRLCSYTPGGAMTLQTHAGQSSIHTVATIDSSDSSIAFDEATLTNFTAGDYIRVGGGHTQQKNHEGRRIGLNLPYNAPAKRNHDYFQARIKEVVAGSPGKLMLEAIPGFKNRFMRNINEQCYPTITTIDNDLQGTLKLQGRVPTQERKLIRTGLSANTLLGCSHGRRWGHIGEKENIEVRDNVGAGTTSSDYAHQIDWKDRTVRAVNLSAGGLRILYMKDGSLHSQNGTDSDVAPSSTVFSDKGSFHLTDTLLTVVDNGGITVYDPNFNTLFVKGRPEKQTGLGLTDDILDGISVANAYGVFVFVKYYFGGNEYWKMVKTGTKPESTLLGYDFVKPIEFDGEYAWGTFKDDDNNYDIHTTVPFYESQIEGSWVNYSASSNAQSAWGQVLKTRLSRADEQSNIKRYLTVDWKYDSGVGTGDPVIGLEHESNKMVGDTNEFTWYLADAPSTLVTSGAGTIITNPKMSLKFKSKVIRDVVFFKMADVKGVLPASGATGGENQISFTNYAVGSQKFYVLNDNIIQLNGTDPDEQGYQLGQADSSADAFDASRLGLSAFLVGAPNMYNPYGPNIDFYYRASFLDKWGNESAPSPLPTAGIEPLDSADDCIQMNMSPEFFRFDNEDITKIRIYRYGGDSSEFMFLTDIDVPKTKIPFTITGFSGTLAIKAALSPFYNLTTTHNISDLTNYTNSAFKLTASPNSIDGYWRINQVYEQASVDYTTTLTSDVNRTATSISVTSNSNFPSSGVVKIGAEYISYTGKGSNTLTGCVRGIYDSKASDHASGVDIETVTWILEMEHRNQDTTTLEGEIISTATNPVPSTIYVKDNSVFNSSGKMLIGNQIINYTGKGTGTDQGLTLTGCTHNSGGGIATNHSVGVTVLSYDETYTAASYSNITIDINELGFRDKSRTPVMSLHSMKEDNYPPLATRMEEEKIKFYDPEVAKDYFRYITAVGSLYFGATDADLRFSRYGSPEYWPLEAVVTLDSEIKGIMEHAGEGIVFTTNSVYRVRGTDPKAMVAFRVPDAKGIKDGDRHSIAEFNGGIIWKTASDGLCMYSGGRVNYLTRDKHKIPAMEKPNSCVADGVYWLFQRPKANREAGDTGNGFRLEIGSNEMKLCQTSIQAYHAYFARALGKAVVVTSDNSLSANDTDFVVQEIGGTKADNISWRSKKIDVGEPASSKAFGSIAIVYESLESKTSPTQINGIRGEALAVSLLGLSADDLDAGGLDASSLDGSSDLYDVFTKYDSVGQEFVADIGGTNWNSAQRKTIIMPEGFDTSAVNVGDSVWAEDDTKNAMLADNTKVESAASDPTSVEVIAGGTNYGHDDGSSGFSSADVAAVSFTNPTNTNILKLGIAHNTPVPLSEGMQVLLKTTGTLPSVLSLNTLYYVTNNTVVGGWYFWELSNTTTVTSADFTATTAGNLLTFTTVGHTLVVGDRVKFSTTGTLPENITAAGLGDGWYVVYVSGNDFRVSQFVQGGQQTGTGLGSGTMTWTKMNGIKADYSGGYGTDVGSGTPSYNGCVLTGTGGGGTGLFGTYEVNTSTGAITGGNIINTGTGYTSNPTVVINDPGPANAGSGATLETSIFPTIILDKEPLRSGTGNIIWGNLPKVHIYINNESTPSRSFTLPPVVSDEPQSTDLYLDDLRKFRTISVKVEGNLRVNTISLRHFPVQQFQSQTLHHSADVFYKGVVDFRVMLDGDLIYRKQLDNAGDEFTEERIYLPASSFGSRVHYMNESRGGMIESVTFNGSLAA